MTTRVIDWNLNSFTSGRWRDKLRLIQETGCDVLLVQECDRETFEGLSDALPAESTFGLDLADDPPISARRRPHAAAIFAMGSAHLHDPATIPGLARASRGIFASIDHDGVRFTAGSFHAPNAVGKAPDRMKPKMGAYQRVTAWLAATAEATPTVLGMDANTPWEDPWREGESKALDASSEWYEDGRLYGPLNEHGLRDAWLQHLAAHPEELNRIRRLRPQGPLAVTYNRGVSGSTKACRYDHLMISEHAHVEAMQFEYADAIGAGSDHALLWADLSFT